MRDKLRIFPKGKNHWNWKGGLPKCPDCGKKISYISVRCIKCHKNFAISEKAPNWKGGRRQARGYIFVYKPEHPFCDYHGYVAEHRFVMERILGRYLLSTEIIHHINGIKNDNRIENLKLFSISEHISFHMIGNKFRKGHLPWNKGIHIRK